MWKRWGDYFVPAGPSSQFAPWSKCRFLSNNCLPNLEIIIMMMMTMMRHRKIHFGKLQFGNTLWKIPFGKLHFEKYKIWKLLSENKSQASQCLFSPMRLNMWSYRGIQQILESYRWARIYKFSQQKCRIYTFSRQKCHIYRFLQKRMMFLKYMTKRQCLALFLFRISSINLFYR